MEKIKNQELKNLLMPNYYLSYHFLKNLKKSIKYQKITTRTIIL